MLTIELTGLTLSTVERWNDFLPDCLNAGGWCPSSDEWCGPLSTPPCSLPCVPASLEKGLAPALGGEAGPPGPCPWSPSLASLDRSSLLETAVGGVLSAF